MAAASFMLMAATVVHADTSGFIQTVYRDWMAPNAAEFARDSAQLRPALQALCDAPADKSDTSLQPARQQWLTTLSGWERLSAVAIGPLIERRSQRHIDFTPTRPNMIEKAVKSAPASLADLELIGTPAKGLPALEWMLWIKPVQPASPECRYAVLLAAEIEREAITLSEAYKQAAGRTPDKAAADTALNELVNQWIGGLERLSWSDLVMPVRVAMTSKREIAPEFPHRVSGATAASWAARWDALRTLATGKGYSMETELRARGQNKLADSLVSATQQTDTAMRGLKTSDKTRVLDAGRELTALKKLVEDKVATALGVHIGFSDADGD
jgi:predicted lipoprotein